MTRLLAIACLAACSSKPTPPTDERRAILEVAGEVIVLKSGSPLAEYRDIVTTALGIDSEVVAAAPFLFDEGMLRAADLTAPIQIKGLTPEHTQLRTDLERYLVRGTIATDAGDEMPLAVGDVLAKTLKVDVGSTVELELASDDPIVAQLRVAPGSHRARITGVFHTGFAEYDATMCLTSFHASQTLLGQGDIAMGVELKLAHPENAPHIAEKLEKALGGNPYAAQDWCTLNKRFFRC